jgi:tetratricopeptide (TPR) repeat protein
VNKGKIVDIKIKMNKNNIPLFENQFLSCWQKANFVECESILKKLIKLAPSNAKYYNNLGCVFASQSLLSKAVDAFLQAITLDSKLADAYVNLGSAYQRNHSYSLSLAQFKQASILSPNNAEIRTMMSTVYANQGDSKNAIDEIKQAINLIKHYAKPRSKKLNPFVVYDGELALNDLRDVFLSNEIPFFLLWGTLLGVVRDGELIPHDKDLDVGLNWDVDRQHVFKALFASNKFALLENTVSSPNSRWCIGVYHKETNVVIDLFFFKPKVKYFYCGIDKAGELNKPILSKVPRFDIGYMQWKGENWPVPANSERFLADVYGDTWQRSDPNFDTLVSNKCMLPESKEARIYAGYARLFERLAEKNWSKAKGYCVQLNNLKKERFLKELMLWIDNQ